MPCPNAAPTTTGSHDCNVLPTCGSSSVGTMACPTTPLSCSHPSAPGRGSPQRSSSRLLPNTTLQGPLSELKAAVQNSPITHAKDARSPVRNKTRRNAVSETRAAVHTSWMTRRSTAPAHFRMRRRFDMADDRTALSTLAEYVAGCTGGHELLLGVRGAPASTHAWLAFPPNPTHHNPWQDCDTGVSPVVSPSGHAVKPGCPCFASNRESRSGEGMCSFEVSGRSAYDTSLVFDERGTLAE